jgi:hypothetical protein
MAKMKNEKRVGHGRPRAKSQESKPGPADAGSSRLVAQIETEKQARRKEKEKWNSI